MPSTLKYQRGEVLAKIKRLKALPRSDKLAQEIAASIELVRQYDTQILIQKATQWGIDPPGDEDWYAHPVGSHPDFPDRQVRIMTPYLSDTAIAILTSRIRKAKFAYWKGWSEIVVTILSLLVAILALLLKR